MAKAYIGTKILLAEPCNLGDYNEFRGWTIPADEEPSREGYKLQYPDGYVSWSPKEVFEGAYREVSGEEALQIAWAKNPIAQLVAGA